MHLRLRHCLLLFIGLPAFAQTPKTELHFTSSKQQKITVYKGNIFVNGNKAFIFQSDDINYSSRRNKLVEDNGNVFLFLEVKGSPNKDRLYVFGINNSKADSLLTAVSSDVKDYDHDEHLEFGGAELSEAYPSNDSMYYIPSKFYEINKGRIIYDATYTEKIDKKANGVFIAEPMDKNGKYVVIPKPKGHL
jgi:hypothetical protein